MTEETHPIEIAATELLPELEQRSAAAAAPLAPARNSPSFRPGRGSGSYCAETAWVWQRARFVCSTPE